ncbi:MAG: hypothetical protein QNJ13_09890 [Paracoccaceae bacterium]|nr:hypothetical protein [Paracoccaceae bacterium]
MTRLVLETGPVRGAIRTAAISEVETRLVSHRRLTAGSGRKVPTLILVERGPELAMMDPGGAPVRAAALSAPVAELVAQFRAGRPED